MEIVGKVLCVIYFIQSHHFMDHASQFSDVANSTIKTEQCFYAKKQSEPKSPTPPSANANGILKLSNTKAARSFPPITVLKNNRILFVIELTRIS